MLPSLYLDLARHLLDLDDHKFRWLERREPDDDVEDTEIDFGLLGIAMGTSTPATFVMAHELAPRRLGIVLRITLGFELLAGTVGAAMNGFVADQVGWATTLAANSVLLVTVPCFLASCPMTGSARVRSRGQDRHRPSDMAVLCSIVLGPIILQLVPVSS